VTSRLVARPRLSDADRRAMFALLASHFDGVQPATFDRDLDDKNWVLLFEDDDGLQGFTTILAYETVDAGEPIAVVYSGDTIMARQSRHTAALPREWIGAVRALGEQLRGRRLYWLLLTAGFRTYRLLPVFWRVFHPRYDAPTPPADQGRLDRLARARLGASFDAAAGIVRFAAPHVLCDALRDVGPGRQRDPHVAFFLHRNPGWVRGDELVCLTEIAFENLTPAGRRMWAAAAAEHAAASPEVAR
jgi:hypothetical protein